VTPTPTLFPLLEDLRAQLATRNTPELRLLGQLGLNPRKYGLTDELYSDQSILELEPTVAGAGAAIYTDPELVRAVHHLALMYHARAFDYESNPAQFDPNPQWKKALEYWHILCQSDLFWEMLARKIDPHVANPFPGLRDSMPERLLNIHFTIAFSADTRPWRAREHIRIALESPFSLELKNQLRQNTYIHFVERVPAAAWDPTLHDAEILEAGIRCISDYLKLDESYLPALSDQLDLIFRRLAVILAVFNPQAGPSEKQGVYQNASGLILTYTLLINRLDAHRSDISPRAQDHLMEWHRVAGIVFMNLRVLTSAADHFEQAALLAEMQGKEDKANEFHELKNKCM
jgi:hypothetical protein